MTDRIRARVEQLARQTNTVAAPDAWAPNPGPQEHFLSLSTFEALYGGAAGGGKSDALLIAAVRPVVERRGYGSGYTAILFRRTFPDLERSLIQRSRELYPQLGGLFNGSKFVWTFPNGERVAFAHMHHETEALAHKSAQYQFVGFDELTSFTEFQYTYLFSRVRSARGVPCRVRAATNPGDVGHEWVRKRFLPWVSRTAPRPARPGKVRYYRRIGDQDTEVPKGTPGALGRTFVAAKLSDNPALEQNDPEYRSRLESLTRLEKERLLGGDWDAVPAKKDFYDRTRVRVLATRPERKDLVAVARAWDFGATSDGDPTVGVLLGWTEAGIVVVLHVERFQGATDEVYKTFGRVEAADRSWDPRVVQGIPEDPGAAGKFVVTDFLARFPRATIRPRRPSGDKVTRFKPASSRALAGHFAVVADGTWDVDAYHAELEAFPLVGSYDDQVDATSDAYALVTGEGDQGGQVDETWVS